MSTPPHERDLVAASRPPKRPPHLLLGMLVGAAVGFAVGTALVLIVNNPTITGHRTDIFTYVFGLPGMLSIPFGVVGAFSILFRYADDPDTPVHTGAHGETVIDLEQSSATSSEAGERPREHAMTR